MQKKTIKDIPQLNKKTVFLRVDFNVSLNNGAVANETRIIEAIPTIRYLLNKGVKIILASHLGRPKGKVNPAYSMLPVVKKTQDLLQKPIHLIENYWEAHAKQKVLEAKEKGIVMLDNLRFVQGEEENSRKFAKHLASFADIYVNDAFGSTHRAHASIVGIPEFLPSYAGLLLDKEITMITKAIENPEKPLVAVIGGAKTPEKISVINKLLEIGDTVLLGGAIANTFLAAWGYGLGRSIVDHEMIEMARVIFWKTTRNHFALMLPQDVVISDKDRKAKPKIVSFDQVGSESMIYDIGPQTQKQYETVMQGAKTIIWNGPMGLFEDDRFAGGTIHILKTLSECTNALTIVGGGDTLTSIKDRKYLKGISHVSTGGGAMLELLQYGTLPGIEVLKDA